MSATPTLPSVWALTRTEYAGQCTGYSSETTWLGLFLKKPDLKTLAPFVGEFLSSDMGIAISQVQTLIDKGSSNMHGQDFELNLIPVGEFLNKG